MSLPKHYRPQDTEPRWITQWQATGVYHFTPALPGPVYSIDTPPATVSGNLHLGHMYSYSHPDFIARFWRMRGYRVFYPMGYDDNGLATERLVERRLGIHAPQVGRAAFIEKCLQVSEGVEKEYESLWQRLGLSIDRRYTYRTIDELARRTSQYSFLELYRTGLAYRREAPVTWCPECQTAIAQAELNDLLQESEFVTLPFNLDASISSSAEDVSLLVATTRPELLPACVAVFVHPADPRYRDLIGRLVQVPLFGQSVPVLADPGADMEKGTGAVMCCTFGDTADVAWWYTHALPMVAAIDRDGRMTEAASEFAGLPLDEARREIKKALEQRGLLLGRAPTRHSLRVHERCDTPVEYIVNSQWFIRLLDFKQELMEAGEKVRWHPESMRARYRAWVENLNWDWCISRQRYYGVPIPVWYCQACGELVLAEEDQLPVDPLVDQPARPCACGSTSFVPEEDVFDTWATSSMTPQIVGRQLGSASPTGDPDGSPDSGDSAARLYNRVFPFSLRPQAHDIIRTWAFYTIVKSHFHFGELPWSDALISGWGVAGEGMGKISKSRGGGPMPPLEMIERYSADAVRYWAASTGPGKDAVISEEKIGMGARLVTKLWNVARFAERFLEDSPQRNQAPWRLGAQDLTPADRWILSRLQKLVRRATELLANYEYAAAKSEIEAFFWQELADNYLEMCKQRLYEPAGEDRQAAQFTLFTLLETLVKLFAPFLPFVTEEIYQGIFTESALPAAKDAVEPHRYRSVHLSRWPEPEPDLESEEAEALGEALVEIATAVRRYKSEHSLPLGTEIDRLQLVPGDPRLIQALPYAASDLMSITRARQVEVASQIDPALETIHNGNVQIAIHMNV